MQENIRFLSEDRKIYNKRAIAKAIADSADKGELICWYSDSAIAGNCSKCDVRDICAGIDNLAEEYRNKNSKVIAEFSFK